MGFEQLVAKLDKSRMLDLILSEPDELEMYYEKYGGVELPERVREVAFPRDLDSIVFTGMGGSAIVGDFARGLLLDRASAAI